jgi:hypothetical protein
VLKVVLLRARELLRAYSEHGGDEDWLAHVPQHMATDYISWMGRGFGEDISDYFMPDGSLVRIGAH